MEVRDVQVVGAARCASSRSSSSWSLRGNTNHEPKNAGTNHGSQTIEPWSVSMRMPAWPSDVARIIAGDRGAAGGRVAGRSGDGRVGVLLAAARHVLGPRRAVPVAQLEAAGRVGVPAGGHRRASARPTAGWSASAAVASRPSRGSPRPTRSPTTRRRSSWCRSATTTCRRSRPSRRRSSWRPSVRRRGRGARGVAAAASSRPSRRPRRRVGDGGIGGVGRRLVAAQVGDDVGAGGDDGDDVPAVGGLLGELGGQDAGLVGRDADGVELVHALIVSREPPAPWPSPTIGSAHDEDVGVGLVGRAVEDDRAVAQGDHPLGLARPSSARGSPRPAWRRRRGRGGTARAAPPGRAGRGRRTARRRAAARTGARRRARSPPSGAGRG